MEGLFTQISTRSFKVEAYFDVDYVEVENSITHKNYNASRYSEEDFQILGAVSPFKTMTYQV